MQSAGSSPLCAGRWKTCAPWARAKSNGRLRAKEKLSGVRLSLPAWKPYWACCIYERSRSTHCFERTRHMNSVIQELFPNLFSFSPVSSLICAKGSVHWSCIEGHMSELLFFSLQGAVGSLCVRPCLLPPVDLSRAADLLRLKPGTWIKSQRFHEIGAFMIVFKIEEPPRSAWKTNPYTYAVVCQQNRNETMNSCQQSEKHIHNDRGIIHYNNVSPCEFPRCGTRQWVWRIPVPLCRANKNN